ncbi:paraquat-inducible membrane protein A [Roseospira marina]|uniref:Paraquat-inducible membrane protein A n=1 Tax=Roseospira marina TaxID=140057 RepID=A0A5M6I708_9PROT|nr:paraquat-inducible protein A [Roseospira marina]KAA5604050.1 paraquat-inducible membrane protein A [Roseospira marina]MBB4315844.1 paraquat-inducible protein A [Roseospira marina]MBB5089016.1 paraquat-inducible protein A [Roseospira marina]
MKALTAGLRVCLVCRTVCHAPGDGMGDDRAPVRCPRCGAAVHARKADSLARTWAFLIAAAILYIPANLLPVMRTSTLFHTSDNTIISGVAYFWTSGSPELAVLIFTVSVVVPITKIVALAFLAWRARKPFRADAHPLGRLYSVVELIGRWSMLDVFVVALMAGMVQFRSFATITAGPGAAAFGAMVVLSMLAAHSFDPRLLWDHHGRSDDAR